MTTDTDDMQADDDLRAENEKKRKQELEQLLAEGLAIVAEEREAKCERAARVDRYRDANNIARMGADLKASRCSRPAAPRVRAETFLALHKMALDAIPE